MSFQRITQLVHFRKNLQWNECRNKYLSLKVRFSNFLWVGQRLNFTLVRIKLSVGPGSATRPNARFADNSGWCHLMFISVHLNSNLICHREAQPIDSRLTLHKQHFYLFTSYWFFFAKCYHLVQVGLKLGLKVWSFSLIVHWSWWWGRFERTVLTHYSCCWRPLRQHSTCTLKLLFGSPLKAYYLHITVLLLLVATLNARYLHI